MSIRMFAAELYRVMKEIQALEKKLATLKPVSEEAQEVEEKLRSARAEGERLKKIIDGAKED